MLSVTRHLGLLAEPHQSRLALKVLLRDLKVLACKVRLLLVFKYLRLHTLEEQDLARFEGRSAVNMEQRRNMLLWARSVMLALKFLMWVNCVIYANVLQSK
ncbi:unnamed protein product, partial [Prorocentrum cordatum]